MIDFPYRLTYYLKHPCVFIDHVAAAIKNRHDRIKKGYCAEDVWSMDVWFLDTIPPMLRELANDQTGVYPGTEPFETPEKWHAWLNDIADKLESCKGEILMEKNTYDLSDDRWLAREQEIDKEKNETLMYCFTELAKYFDHLWS